ncbi:hypothetical protein E4T47_02612 [Aureobasidium subglaciale]|nr:hypothetical protein E4T43_02224 [Aureobasidium subglaciale]KAI5274375.1 hypothetical protein E4T47_02612 [Aureobasidium subglaciale]
MPLEITAKDMQRLAAVETKPSPQKAPQRSEYSSKDTWLNDFNRYAENSHDLVDTLHPQALKEVIEAISPTNLAYRLSMLASIYTHIDSNEAAAEGLHDMIEVLESEMEHLDEHIGKMLADLALSSPKLVDEYVALEKHARNTTHSKTNVAAIITWKHNWPRGFALLLRVHAVHTRRIDDLKSKHDLITAGRLDYKQFSKKWHILLWDEGLWPHGYGYERTASTDFAEYHRPSLTKISPSAAIGYVRSSAIIRSERRRSALDRLAKGRGGESDFLVSDFVDYWFHGFSSWLDTTLPLLYQKDPAYATMWIDLARELNAMHREWIAEADYDERGSVLITKNARFTLRQNRRVHREVGVFSLPSKHTPLCIHPN